MWPKPDKTSLVNFYGNPDTNGDGLPDPIWEKNNILRIDPPYPMVLAWDIKQPVKKIAIHKNCSASLTRVLKKIGDKYTAEQLSYYQLDQYGGAYNFRTMRGSSNLSMHSYGCAIDLAPSLNGLGVKYKPDSKMIPMEIVRIFEAEGWKWGGDWSRPDSMHFECTS